MEAGHDSLLTDTLLEISQKTSLKVHVVFSRRKPFASLEQEASYFFLKEASVFQTPWIYFFFPNEEKIFFNLCVRRRYIL